MAATVETLEKLERKITLHLPLAALQGEVQSRLKQVARTVKMDGFRPGKVPMSVVSQRYGNAVYNEALNDQAGEAFLAAAQEAGLQLAGQIEITHVGGEAPEGQLRLEAHVEVLPEVAIGELSGAEVQRLSCAVDEAAIDRTLEVLRQQRRTFAQRPHEGQAADGDRVTVDFDGKIDAQPFDGGKAVDFQWMLGGGQMLPAFDDAVRGMKTGESKTFALSFPADYHADVAGKTADFMLTVKKIEEPRLPDITPGFIKSLGVTDGSMEGLRADIRKNLEREVKYRLQSLNKRAVIQALLARAELELPKGMVREEEARLQAMARQSLRERGFKDSDKVEFPPELFLARARDNVRLALVGAEMVKIHDLRARPDQVKAHVQELASSYEKPHEVEHWYFSDDKRLARVKEVVTENNVVEYVLGQVTVQAREVSFEELMRLANEAEQGPAQADGAQGADNAAPPLPPPANDPDGAASA